MSNENIKIFSETIKLDVGCGPNKKSGYLGVDIKKIGGVDIVVDLNREKLPFEDYSVDEIYCSHFLEHVEDPVRIIKEFARVLKDKGTIVIKVPHYTNPYAYHFTHKTYWSSYAFERQYIDYYLEEGLVLKNKRIRIVSPIAIFDPIFNFLANLNHSFYERVLAIFIKAWEVKFVLKKDDQKKNFINIK